MENVITIEVTLTFRHYLRLCMSAGYRRTRWLAALMLLMFFFLVFIDMTGPRHRPIDAACRDNEWVLIFWVLWLALVFFLRYTWAKRTWRESAFMHEPLTYQFSAMGLAYSGRTHAGSTAWCNIVRAARTGPLLVLYMNRLQADLIPIAAFRDAQQLEDVKALLRQNVRDCRRL